MSERTALAATSIESDHGYPALELMVRDRIANSNTPGNPLFRTDAEGLFEAYLEAIPKQHRQHYNCRACQQFIERYGGLVHDAGNHQPHRSLFWDDLSTFPIFFHDSVAAMNAKVASARITGAFVSSDETWGTPTSKKGWTHLSGVNPNRHASLTKTAHQAEAEKNEDRKMLIQGLADYPIELVRNALIVLRHEGTYRSEKALGITEWFLSVHEAILGLKENKMLRCRDGVIWRFAASAPAGFCHVRSTMISTLLDDLASGASVEQCQRRWALKMNPLQYQRPTTISDGAVKQAEEIIGKLGAAGAFKRRYATLDDVLAKLWVPAPTSTRPGGEGGLFDYLKKENQQKKDLEMPVTTVTWVKFRDTVLPNAVEMQYYVSHGLQPFYGMVTAEVPDSPPIVQWDGIAGLPRNPCSTYVYVHGSRPDTWKLSTGWATVTAAFLGPHRWQLPDQFDHHGDNVYFALKGAVDWNHGNGGGWFPEILKAEFHGIRSVLEAHARNTSIAGKDAGDANGVAFGRNSPHFLTFRVRSRDGSVATYKLDRWD